VSSQEFSDCFTALEVAGLLSVQSQARGRGKKGRAAGGTVTFNLQFDDVVFFAEDSPILSGMLRRGKLLKWRALQ
jgi:hypothetical protein